MMRLIDAEEFKHKINNSELYGTDMCEKVLDMLAECETRIDGIHCSDCWYKIILTRD